MSPLLNPGNASDPAGLENLNFSRSNKDHTRSWVEISCYIYFFKHLRNKISPNLIYISRNFAFHDVRNWRNGKMFYYAKCRNGRNSEISPIKYFSPRTVESLSIGCNGECSLANNYFTSPLILFNTLILG